MMRQLQAETRTERRYTTSEEEQEAHSQERNVKTLRLPLAPEGHIGGVQLDLTLKGKEEAERSLAAVRRRATVGVIVHL